MTRVMIIGLDSATLDLIQLGIGGGRLPNFAKFQEDGVLGPLQSTYPPASCPAWNSFSTGKNPGHIGVPWFFVRKSGTYQFQPYIFDNERHEVPFWDYASQAGRRIGIVNVPTMYRASPLNGFSVSGFFRMADSPLTFPSELEQEIEEAVGLYQVDIWDARRTLAKSPADMGGRSAPTRGDIVYEMARRNAQNRRDTLRYLLQRYWDWDLFVGVFTALDRLQHRLLTPAAIQIDSLLMEYYVLLDGYLGELTQLVGSETNIILMSDHGMGPVSWTFNINDWLCEIGLLCLRSEPDAKSKSYSLREFLRQLVLPVSEKHPSFDHWVQVVKSAVGIKNFASEGKPFDADLIDWEKTKAYSYGNYGEIFLNLEGREPKGQVAPDEVNELYNYISSQIHSIQFPWRPHNIEILRGSELFQGTYSHKMPDFLIKIDDYQCITSSSLQNPTCFIRKKGGVHRLTGILGAIGPDFIAGGDCQGSHINDIAPTVLHLLNVPVPQDVDGKVLLNLLTNSAPVVYQAALETDVEQNRYSEQDEKRLADHLRALGYLD